MIFIVNEINENNNKIFWVNTEIQHQELQPMIKFPMHLKDFILEMHFAFGKLHR